MKYRMRGQSGSFHPTCSWPSTRTRMVKIVNDEAEGFRQWLDEHPDATLEIITNSVLTSDNFPAQSVIDMETAPRLYLPPEMREQWQNLKGKDEMTSELVNSEKWLELVSNPQAEGLRNGPPGFHQAGSWRAKLRQAARQVLHFAEDIGFIGTTNFDYRSRLYNNEMGFFFLDPGLAADVHASFDGLVSISYLWGSPEWFQMRKEVMGMKGTKGRSTKRQRNWYKLFKNTGIIWLL